MRYHVAFYMPWIGSLLAGEPSSGGAEKQMLLVARGMAERRLRVCVVVHGPDTPLPASVDGVDVVVVQPLRRGGLRPRLLAQLWSAASTLWRLDTEVVVQRAAGPVTGAAALFARLRGRRFVYSSASVVDFDYGRIQSRRQDAWSFQLGVRMAQDIIVQTEEQAALCRRRLGRQPLVIKSVAELAESRTRPGCAFLWAGRLAPYKRPEAFLELARRVPDASFRMVGVATDEDEQRSRRKIDADARELPNLTLLPALRPDEMAREVAAAVAVVNTSEFEGMPNVFLEGWSRGVPALSLAHDPDGVIERERLGGFADGSAERLADLARSMWGSRSNSAEQAGVCREYVAREHSPDAVVSRWIQALGLEGS